MPRSPAEATQQPQLVQRPSPPHANVHGHAVQGWHHQSQGQRQASPSRTIVWKHDAALLNRGIAVSRPSSANSGAKGAELSDSEQCQCSMRTLMRRANASRNDHGEELDAAAADLAMQPFVGLGCVLCCSVMVLLLILRPNRAPSLSGVLHKGEVCAARRASHRRRPHSTHCGHKRGLRRAAPLLLLAAWLGVSSAKGITVCSVQPSVCSGTYSSPSLCAAPPPQPTSALAFPARDGGVQRHGGRRAAAALRLASLLLTLTPPDPAPLTQGHRKPSDERLHAYAARGTYRVEHDAP